jgi:hypothetical protein
MNMAITQLVDDSLLFISFGCYEDIQGPSKSFEEASNL